jgi:uncharacterized protein DUF4864
MDDPLNIPQRPLEDPREESQENASKSAAGQDPEPAHERSAGFVTGVAPDGCGLSFQAGSKWSPHPLEPTQIRTALPSAARGVDETSRKRHLRHNLLLLLSLTLAAFVLTAWILVRVDSPVGISSTGPKEIVSAQLRALDRGELRPAYDMFSARYRQQVSFDVWHELIVTHWRMFHAEVLRAGEPAQTGPGVTLEIHLRGSDDKDYRARFMLIRLEGRWWIDDVHWAEESDEQNTVRT